MGMFPWACWRPSQPTRGWIMMDYIGFDSGQETSDFMCKTLELYIAFDPKKRQRVLSGQHIGVLTNKISKSEMMARFYLVAPSLFRFMIFTWLSIFGMGRHLSAEGCSCDVGDRTLSLSKFPWLVKFFFEVETLKCAVCIEKRIQGLVAWLSW